MPRKNDMDGKRRKYTEVLEQLIIAITAGMTEEFGYPPEEAKKRALVAMDRIQSEASGTGIYIAKGHLWYIGEKHRRIYRRFTGNNHAALAREFDLSERQVYSIIAAVEKEEQERRQGKLFA